ncbi:MAG: hypothetical protein CME71_02030 [Halobacteriovorax sp.]|nr:hypothetical protein [Halobacteriovorax sp.]|tara:strand:+ start:2359 stop:2769 length:411 start_codon:yes stop_codon:yes gene_type:complete
MKKLLVGLLTLGCISSAYANTEKAYAKGYSDAMSEVKADYYTCTIVGQEYSHSYFTYRFTKMMAAEGLGRSLALENLMKKCDSLTLYKNRDRDEFVEYLDDAEEWIQEKLRNAGESIARNNCKEIIRSKKSKCYRL